MEETEHLEEMLAYAVEDITSSIPMKVPIRTERLITAWLGRFWSMGNSSGKEVLIQKLNKQIEDSESIYLIGFADGVKSTEE